MKKLLLILLFFSATAAAQTPKSPIAYNNKLADYLDTMFVGGQEWGKVFEAVYPTGNYIALKVETDKLDVYIDRSIRTIEAMQDLKNSKPLRTAVIEFLNYEKTLISKAFRPFEKFKSDTPEATIQAAIDNLMDLSIDENEYLKKVKEAQKKYAAENGFTIEGDEEDGH